MSSSKLVLVAALLVLVGACSSDEPPPRAQRDCTWVVGTMGALSGEYASIGQPIFQGVEYAVDEANERGDLACTIELKSEDSQGDPNQAPPLARSLVEEERLVAIIGPYFSGETLATGKIFDQAGVAFITPSATNQTIDDQGFSTFFRAVAGDDIQADVAARYVASLRPKRVAVVHDNQDYSKGVAEGVLAGLGDLGQGPFIINPEETDYSAVVAEIRELDPEIVFYGGYSPQAGPLLRQMREAGVQANFISDDGTKDSTFGDLAGPASEGAQVTCPCADPLQIDQAQEFVEGIQATYDRPPGTFAADAYDSSRLVFAALGRLDGEESIEGARKAVTAFLDSVDGYRGVTKRYSFDDKGQLVIGPEGIWVYEWSQKDGDFIAIGPASELIQQ